MTSRARVVRTGTSRVSTSTCAPAASARAHQVEADGVVVARHPVELEPQHVRRDLRGRLDGGAADRAEHVGHARRLRGGGEILVGARPHDRRPAHRRDADRRRVAAAEQLDVDRRQLGGDAVARHELDRVERRPVALDAGVVGSGAAVHVFEREARPVPRRMPAQIRDGRKAADQAGLVLQAVPERRRRQRRQLRCLGAVVHRRSSALRFFYQKWLYDGRANLSALPCTSRKRAAAGSLGKPSDLGQAYARRPRRLAQRHELARRHARQHLEVVAAGEDRARSAPARRRAPCAPRATAARARRRSPRRPARRGTVLRGRRPARRKYPCRRGRCGAAPRRARCAAPARDSAAADARASGDRAPSASPRRDRAAGSRRAPRRRSCRSPTRGRRRARRRAAPSCRAAPCRTPRSSP